MSEHLRIVVEQLRRSGERTDVAGTRGVAEQLAARTIALARVATVMHMQRTSKQGLPAHHLSAVDGDQP